MLRRFQIELSDIDRGIYESLDFRLAQHPSETIPYLLTRALAYALSYDARLQFAPAGLHDPDAPALSSAGDHGATDLWIEIGNPSPRKLHKASKAASRVAVYTYKNPELLIAEMAGAEVHRASEIEIYAFDSAFLSSLEERLEKNNKWSMLVQDGGLSVQVGESSVATEVRRLRI
jgi:uncharacterized protein YaeQ